VFGLATVAAIGMTTALAQQEPAARSSQGRPIALVGGTLLDGTGGASVRNSVVLIRGERIEAIGTIESLPVPGGYEVISSEGLTVVPGLWDLHVHLMYAGHPNARYWFDTYTPQFERVIMPASAEQLLMAGVTTARDLAAPPREIVAVKKRIATGEIPGPTSTWPDPRSRRGPTRMPYRRGTSRALPTPGGRPGN
jgi:imidazolonepropionase-like amidohydrolase